MVQISPKTLDRMVSVLASRFAPDVLEGAGGLSALREDLAKEFESEIRQYQKMASSNRDKSRMEYSTEEGRAAKKEAQRVWYRRTRDRAAVSPL